MNKYRLIKITSSYDDPNYLLFLRKLKKDNSIKYELFDRNIIFGISNNTLLGFALNVYDYDEEIIFTTKEFTLDTFDKIFDKIDELKNRPLDHI
jgi:hypothetical protein